MRKNIKVIINKAVENPNLFNKNMVKTRRNIRKAIRNSLTLNGFSKRKYKIVCNSILNEGNKNGVYFSVFYKKGIGYRYINCEVSPSKKGKS
jgi:hypothetical protein